MQYTDYSGRQFTPVQWLFIALLSFTVWFTAPVQAQELQVNASVNKNPVLEFESFTLTVTANQGLPRNAFQPEQYLQGFDIRGTAVSSSSSVINNQSVRSTEWQVTLIAPRAGDYEIPALAIGGATTQPIPLQVVEQRQDADQNEEYFLQAELDTQQPYVQQQVRLTVRLFLAMQLEAGSIQLPELEHFHVEQLGQDRQSQDIIDGRRYQVLTRVYLLTPRRSGNFDIPPIRFDGQVRVAPSGGFSAFGRLQTISARSEPFELQVRPRPSNFSGHWLPSEHVLLEEQWDPNETLWTLGEPITRTVTFTAAGIRPEQLPEISIEYPQALRVYPDRGQTEMRVLRGVPVARAQYTTAIIPAQSGEFTLPAVRVPWWNTQSDQLEYAELPERTVRVVSPPGGILPPGHMDMSELSGRSEEPLAGGQEPLAGGQEPSAGEQHSADAGTPPAVQARNIPLPMHWWLLTGFFFLLWLITLVWALQRNRSQTKTVTPSHKVPVAARGALQEVKDACQKNDAQACKSALYKWHQARTGTPPAGLTGIAQSLASKELGDALAALEAALYSPQKPQWTGGKQLWTLLTRIHRRDQDRHQNQALPPLYPHQ